MPSSVACQNRLAFRRGVRVSVNVLRPGAYGGISDARDFWRPAATMHRIYGATSASEQLRGRDEIRHSRMQNNEPATRSNVVNEAIAR